MAKKHCTANVKHQPSGLIGLGVGITDSVTGAVHGSGDFITGGTTSATGTLDKVYFGLSLKIWIMIFLVVVLVGHIKKVMPWNTPAVPAYYW